MGQAQINSFDELSEISGVSQWQLNRLLVGLIAKMSLETLLKLAKTLQISLEYLLSQFCTDESLVDMVAISQESSPGVNSRQLEHLKQEYQHLEQQLSQQRDILQQEFQEASLQVLESWLLQWPTAAAVAKKNPQLSAIKLLPLVKPITELLKQWGLEMNGTVGEQVSYDPQYHQLLEGSGEANPGDAVMVRYVGYRQADKLLYRAKVSPVNLESVS
ncbi:chaperone protein GrpE [Aphanothece sacrum FPU1]|uniref:Chaperone protein GrpE n=2 Tax=Aphanothece sacrum TaxID=1122 RepID=A0A401IL95_APHSA|nr:chaperone protein GrpE [Aphanothece sacrum FPU1]GBF85847.1 molecular chaperone GrpE protein [Aphanothece sacrum FPU3]